ncbi:unnamed protein product [Ranitomeya imitator]|uniref:Uncharacterized protein n=1 Tax=Ranitomeya imitator TaxID=111125 RepID=A0ABN9MQR3_9NEOB|nr:unnamed protein product [Ranitomeya imitator]
MELEPGMKKTKVNMELCSAEKDDATDARCLNLADLRTDTADRSTSIDVPDGPNKSSGLVHSGLQDKENRTPEKNWLSAMGSKKKSDKSTSQCKVTHSPSSSSGSAKKTPTRSTANSPKSAPASSSARKISMYFHKKPTDIFVYMETEKQNNRSEISLILAFIYFDFLHIQLCSMLISQLRGAQKKNIKSDGFQDGTTNPPSNGRHRGGKIYEVLLEGRKLSPSVSDAPF